MKFSMILLLAILLALVYSQTETCYSDCYVSSGCQKNDGCMQQLFFCDNSCDSYADAKLELECLIDCSKSYPENKLTVQFKNFLKCQGNCINGIISHVNSAFDSNNNKNSEEIQEEPKIEQVELTKSQRLRQQFQENPTSHTGQTLAEIDCDNIKQKKKAYIRKGNTHQMIIDYFKSRCDYVMLPDSKINSPDFDFKWCDYHYQHNYKTFKPGKQVINHVQNLKDLISFKDQIVLTYREFDKKQLYDFDSTSFHFDTYIFNLKSKEYNEEEKYFFENVNDGLWITKDPDGSLGLGIQLFKDVQTIKDRIADIKANPQRKYQKQERILQYSVIQNYMAKPLLIDNKKIDLRGYVLIASLDPFVVLYQNGFIRKCIKDYDTDFKAFDQNEAYKHLTNRIYQKKHPDYEQEKENLMLNPLQFEEFLRKEHNFEQEDIDDLYKKGQKTVAYSMMAAKEKFIKQKGIFQLMGVDLIWDEDFKVKLIEFNTSAGLYQTLQGHKYVVPQLVQSTLDLILETFEDVENVREKWEKPEELELGRWEIIINDATGYNILDENLRVKKNREDL